MDGKRLNVLVYSGRGSTVESVRHAIFTLRRLLSPQYAVSTIGGETLIKEPWAASCALLVMPGGADLGYCEVLNGAGNRKIENFVGSGGAYIGFCAGGYYGSSRCEFEAGNKHLEVVGSRELAFFPGTCRGCAFKGFKYGSEAGARAVELRVDKTSLGQGAVPAVFRSYYNGGGVFVDAAKFHELGVEVLASYTEPLDIDAGEGAAAIIYRKIGKGAVMLTGPHPEFASRNLEPKPDPPFFPQVVETLDDNENLRNDFVKACFRKLGMKVNKEQNAVPSLSRLHLSSSRSGEITRILTGLREIITVEASEEYIKDENDTFLIEKPPTSSMSMSELQVVLPRSRSKSPVGRNSSTDSEDRILDYSTVVKHILPHTQSLPKSSDTPYFNHEAYFDYLEKYQHTTQDADSAFGQTLLYGEVVTSTNTLLEKNTQTLRRLSAGFTACATVQVAGRGRGSNVWVSPAGSLMFSVLFHHPMSLMTRSPIVFLQYIAALAVVEGIHSYDKGYEKLPIKLKWPNDIYAVDPSAHLPVDSKTPPPPYSYVKIGGILVNSHYSTSTYHSVLGIGLNTTNTLPTTSLSALLSHLASTITYSSSPPRDLAPLTSERLLARIVTTLSALYNRFCITGFDGYFERMYYRHWLHSEQVVTLETEGGIKARIKGITTDWGLLVAEEILGGDGVTRERAGRRIELQADGNGFDFFRGLLKRKV